jgi:hypothetical protein
MAVSTKMAVFWVVAPCGLVYIWEVLHQGERRQTSIRLHGATTQKTAIFLKNHVFVITVHCLWLQVSITNQIIEVIYLKSYV